MTWNLQNITLTDAVSPMDGVTVGKLFLEKDVYICVIRIDNGEFSTLGQLTPDELEILTGCGDVGGFPMGFMLSLGRKWLLCSTKAGAKNEFSEKDICSYWVFHIIRD